MLRLFAIGSVVALSALPAQAFIATNALLVKDTGGETFEVPYRGPSGASDFWCAAGDYVIRERNHSPNKRIYRTSSPPRRASEGISFSLSSENAKATGLAHWSRDRGMSASHARQFCERDRYSIDD